MRGDDFDAEHPDDSTPNLGLILLCNRSGKVEIPGRTGRKQEKGSGEEGGAGGEGRGGGVAVGGGGGGVAGGEVCPGGDRLLCVACKRAAQEP